jgi:hypothetical protein
MLVVVTIVAMVSLSPLIDGDDLLFGDWLSKRLVPRTALFKVQALEEGTPEPVDKAEDDANTQDDAEAKKYPTQTVHVPSGSSAHRPPLHRSCAGKEELVSALAHLHQAFARLCSWTDLASILDVRLIAGKCQDVGSALIRNSALREVKNPAVQEPRGQRV